MSGPLLKQSIMLRCHQKCQQRHAQCVSTARRVLYITPAPVNARATIANVLLLL